MTEVVKKPRLKSFGPPKVKGGYLRFERPQSDWTPVMPPDLLPGEDIGLDYEYRGSKDPCHATPFSCAVYSGQRGQGWYLPWGHEAGGNLPQEQVVAWLKNNLYKRTVHGLNTKAEVHMTMNLGLEPDRLKLYATDVAHNAALLNENRRKGFSLEALCEEYLPEEERKVHAEQLDPQQFYLGHASEVANRCVSDARQAYLIHQATWPQMQKENLEKVFKLESRSILPTVEMERNGCPIDVDKLVRWRASIDERMTRLHIENHQECGFITGPDDTSDLRRLYRYYGLTPTQELRERKLKNGGTHQVLVDVFDDDELKKLMSNPVFARVRVLRKLKSLKSKYLDKYLYAVDKNNILRWQLHQLRSVSDESEDNTNGTVTGRYSCGGGDYSINVQQVWKCEHQAEEFGFDDYIVRELYVPEKGRAMGASDAAGIEFRLFGHFSNSPLIIGKYDLDPETDFHMLVTRMMKPNVTDLKELKRWRKFIKHQNFGKVYGMGRPKLAWKLELDCVCNVTWFNGRNGNDKNARKFADNRFHNPECPARQANDIADEYDATFPEAGRLLDQASDLAEERGYVMTLFGRRRRFIKDPHTGKVDRVHKALNAVIQGSAADVFKFKLCELYDNRHDLGITLRIPKHDEEVYDVDPDPVAQDRVHQLLDEQTVNSELNKPLKVPLLWDSGFGSNWMIANGWRKDSDPTYRTGTRKSEWTKEGRKSLTVVPEVTALTKEGDFSKMENQSEWLSGPGKRFRGGKA